VAVVALAIGVGIVWAGWQAEVIGQRMGPAMQRLVSLSGGRLVRGFGGLLLFLAAQLALVIWWVRSRSHTDFSGRYRIWAWVSGAGFVFSASVSLGLHRVWSESLLYLLEANFPHGTTLCWLAPAVGCASVLLRDAYADMRDCRSSTTFLWLAMMNWSAAAVQLLGWGVGLPREWAAVVVISLALAGHYCLFVSMLLHARFVTFVSAEPPRRRHPLLMPLLRRLLAAVRMRRTSSAKHNRNKERSTDTASDTAPENGARQPEAGGEKPGRKTAKESSSKQTTPPTDKQTKNQRPAPDGDDHRTMAQAASSTKRNAADAETSETSSNQSVVTGNDHDRREEQPEGSTSRVDPSQPSTPKPKRLSKRERKKRRKQQRGRKKG